VGGGECERERERERERETETDRVRDRERKTERDGVRAYLCACDEAYTRGVCGREGRREGERERERGRVRGREGGREGERASVLEERTAERLLRAMVWLGSRPRAMRKRFSAPRMSFLTVKSR
jgi:hypothetical protein